MAAAAHADGAAADAADTGLGFWFDVPRARWIGGNQVRLLEGGAEMFPAIERALAGARHEVWFATYIFHDDASARAIARSLVDAAARGVEVHVVVDGFGSNRTLPTLRRWLAVPGLQLEVFRPIDRWWRWLQPGQLRRMHQKLCVVDDGVAFVGGINVIDDHNDINHGWSELPRLDYAVELRGPLVEAVRHAARAMWARAHLRHDWRGELARLARSERPMTRTLQLIRRLSAIPRRVEPEPEPAAPVRAAFVMRDNLRQRRAIEHRYVSAIGRARERIDIACPYFYPGRSFMGALRKAARRGVKVRLLMQGKVDYRLAALAARAVYDELRAHGVRIYEYTPAFLHAKVACVDETWATVGSSNIDPLSLLLNLEANVVVRDRAFTEALAARLERAFEVSTEVTTALAQSGWRRLLHRGFVAWAAQLYLRVAGVTGRY
ncbi:MAG: cardiolipin synthase ClsB [Burkholderiales bacterium]|nr:cardiolipin synthase ClsB [Burkholderiales bacterium]